MKKLLLIAFTISLIVFTTASAFAHGGLDSIIFDGDESSDYFQAVCAVKVLQVKGKAVGRIQKKVMGGDCGQYYASLVWTDGEQLSQGDIADAAGTFVTDAGAELTLEMPNGSIVVLGSKTAVWFPQLCGADGKDGSGALSVLMNLINGTAKVNYLPSPPLTSDPPIGKRGKVRVKTSRLTAEPKGTSYIVDAGAEGGTLDHIVKVYEGEVEVTATRNAVAAEMGDLSSQTKALADEFQKGKISQSEFASKLKELSSVMQDKGERINIKPVMVNAGYMVTVDIKGTVSKPQAFDVRRD